VQVGDLVKVIAPGLRPITDSVGLVTKMQSAAKGISGGTVFYCWALMTQTQETYKFRIEHVEVISESR
jgi:hypothetical protein